MVTGGVPLPALLGLCLHHPLSEDFSDFSLRAFIPEGSLDRLSLSGDSLRLGLPKLELIHPLSALQYRLWS